MTSLPYIIGACFVAVFVGLLRGMQLSERRQEHDIRQRRRVNRIMWTAANYKNN